MNKIILFIALFITNISFGQTSFEIIQKVVNHTGKQTVKYDALWKVTENNTSLELDYSGSGLSNIVFISKNNELYFYSKKTSETENYYYKNVKNVSEKFEVFQSSEKSIINGYDAIKYYMKSKSKYIEFWFTEDVDINVSSFTKIFVGTDFNGIGNSLPSKGFILSYTVKENGTITNSVSLSSANSASFNPSIFEFPKGYSLFVK